MKQIINGVTTQKSIEEMEKEVKVFNEKMKPINDWQKEERSKRAFIAQNSTEHDNTTCPICGREITIRESCNGLPLVDACVCSECDMRYVFPFRMMTRDMSKKDIKGYAGFFLSAYMNAEMIIECTKRTKLLIANHSDVA